MVGGKKLSKEVEALSNIISIKEMLFDEVRTVFQNEGMSSTES
jgi:hypothetical protein